MLKYPSEMIELRKIFEPYKVGCHLENPTPEAKEAWDKYYDWFRKATEDLQ